MNAVKMAAMGLILVGILVLVYGAFSNPKDTHDTMFAVRVLRGSDDGPNQ